MGPILPMVLIVVLTPCEHANVDDASVACMYL